jgi:two-component system, NarL family, sensor kinase
MNSTIVIAIITGTVLLLILVIFTSLIISSYTRRKIKHITEIELQKQAFNNTLMQSQLAIKEQTLQHISEEIHDNIGQTLTLAKLELNTSNLHNEKINSSINYISNAIANLRNLSKSMHGASITNIGIIAALQLEIDKLENTKAFNIISELDNNVKLSDEKTIILFRMFQELINNILKHANASSINISLNKNNNLATLEITDNGIGFDVVHTTKNIGMQSLQNRANLLGGFFSVESIIGKGTTAKITIPL